VVDCLSRHQEMLGNGNPLGAVIKRGRVRFFCKLNSYPLDTEVEERNGTFTFTLCAAQDLSNDTPWFESVYATLTNDNNDKQARSRCIPNCLCPEWKQEFKFPINCDTLEVTLKVR
jgi:hypothetical protein